MHPKGAGFLEQSNTLLEVRDDDHRKAIPRSPTPQNHQRTTRERSARSRRSLPAESPGKRPPESRLRQNRSKLPDGGLASVQKVKPRLVPPVHREQSQ